MEVYTYEQIMTQHHQWWMLRKRLLDWMIRQFFDLQKGAQP